VPDGFTSQPGRDRRSGVICVLVQRTDHPVGILERNSQGPHRPHEDGCLEICSGQALASERNAQSLCGSPQDKVRGAEAWAFADIKISRSVHLAPLQPTGARLPSPRRRGS
jgi:hypothetical protein